MEEPSTARLAGGPPGEEEGCPLGFCRGILALSGPAVDFAAASGGLAAVPRTWREARRQRDGESFHITFLAKADVQALASALREGDCLPSWAESSGGEAVSAADPESIARAAARLAASHALGLRWFDVGEGRAKGNGSEASFRVVLWPGGAAARRALGLEPMDFHITLGFCKSDVHGRPKGLSSLLAGAPSPGVALKLASEVRCWLDACGASSDVDAAAMEQLADAALLGARARKEAGAEVQESANEAELVALRCLCVLQGRLKRPQRVLVHADSLLELVPDDELGFRCRGFALLLLGRHKEALSAIEAAQGRCSQLSVLPEAQRQAVERRLVQAADVCRRRLRALAEAAQEEGHEEVEVEFADDDFESAFLERRELKFPSTPHLKNLGAATRDDKLLDAQKVALFCGSGKMVTVEEKVDGANLGISLDSQYQARLQARSKLVNWETDYQFRGLEEWLQEHAAILCRLLERNRDILFGEWCAYRHTVEYTALPGYFLSFDIYDRKAGRFLSRQAFHGRLRAAGQPFIAAVPVVARRQFSNVQQVEALLSTRSRFGDCPLEGVYLRIDEEEPSGSTSGQETHLQERCKLVRAEFLQAIEDGGSFRGRGKNELDMELSTTYPEQSHLLASVAGSSVAGEAFAAEAKGNYPKTPHLPFSPGVNSDDSKLADCGTLLAAGEVVVTEKLDGGNCCIKGGQVYSRTHSQPATHESFSAVKTLAAEFAASLGEVELYGENLQAIHSIEYGNLASYFYVFAARRQGTWLSWDEVERVASEHGLQLVPLVFRGSFASAEQLQRSFEAWAKEPSAVGSSVTPEGFVVRHAGQIAADKFGDCVGKYVRAGHIQTDDSWRRRWKKATLGPALHPRALRLLEDPLYAKLKDPRQRHMVKVSCLGREVPLPRNFSFIVEDVAVSSTPKNREQIIAMASLGITLVVTLTEETPLPADWFHGTGVHNLFVPVENYHPPSLNQADSILDDFARVIQSQSKVMVHCGGGKGRAGTVAACMLLRYGINGVGAALQLEQASDGGATCHCHMQSDEVITYLREARPGSVETKHQELFIREYASVLWRRAAEAPGPLPVLQRQLSRQRSQIEEDSLVQAELFDGSQLAFPSSNSNNNSNNNNNNNNNKNTNNNSNNHNNFSSSCAAASGSAPSSGPGFVPPERRKAPAAASRAEKDAARLQKEAQKRGPRYAMLVGLSGAGKSTFARRLEAAGSWVRANQDDHGRKGCVEILQKAVPLVRQGTRRLVLDRCNSTRAERKEWLDTLGGPAAKDVVCVFFDYSAEECKQRAAAREGHPTIRHGGGGRIIDAQAKTLEAPHASEGFGTIEVVRSFKESDALLRRWGLDAGASREDEPQETTKEKEEEVFEEAGAMGGDGGQDREGSDEVEGGCRGCPSSFLHDWLHPTLLRELNAGAADAEGLAAAVEVIVGAAAGGSSEELSEALDAAAGVLRDGGAPGCASELAARWFLQ